jgi:predicted amidophosphoribosyltransferase
MKNLSLLDFVFPSGCAVCDSLGPNICEDCRWVVTPSPHGFQRGPVFGKAATYHSPEVSKLLVSFKDRGQSALVSDLTELMAPLVAELAAFTERVYLVPAPSRMENFARRGYTPSVVLARALANQVSNSRVLNCLLLAKNVKDQVGLSASLRHSNLIGSMSLNQEVVGKSCFVVDDICTTGATLTEAWRALMVGGANVLGALVISESKPTLTL